MKTFALICILLCASITSRGQSERSGNFSLIDSLIQCERCYFESSDPMMQNECLLRKAHIYHSHGLYLEALNTYDRLSFHLLGDSLIGLVFIKMAANSYVLGNYEEAIAYCDFIPENAFKKHFGVDVAIIKTLSYNQLNEYSKARQSINELLANLELAENVRDSLTNIFDYLYSAEKLPSFRDPDRAEWLSTFVPGLGQSYAGYYVEGAANLLTHLIIAGLTGYATYKAYYLTAYFGGVNLFMKFYFGNPTRAAYLANKRNYRHQQNFTTEVRNHLNNIVK